MTDAVAVIPSNREIDERIIDALSDIDVAVVEAPGFDRPEPRERLHILDAEQQHADFGPDLDLLGHGSAALRNYGVWWAFRNGYDLIINLDDDCYPQYGLADAYREILVEGTEATPVASPSGWVSTLGSWFPRGFPYEERLRGHKQERGAVRFVRPVVQVGLWDGTLDLNAVDKIAYGDEKISIPRSCLATSDHLCLCAMNFACLSGWAPFVYQIPWTGFGSTLPLWRYDDIIGGLITCALARLEGELIGFGPPSVDHQKKDGDLMAHAVAENLGNVVIGRFASLLDLAVSEMEVAGSAVGKTVRVGHAYELLSRLNRLARGTDLDRIVGHVAGTYSRWLGYFA